jgi:hypothetical protein
VCAVQIRHFWSKHGPGRSQIAATKNPETGKSWNTSAGLHAKELANDTVGLTGFRWRAEREQPVHFKDSHTENGSRRPGWAVVSARMADSRHWKDSMALERGNSEHVNA